MFYNIAKVMNWEMSKRIILFLHWISLVLLLTVSCKGNMQRGEQTGQEPAAVERIIPGAERTELYFPLLAGSNVAVVANHTSLIGETHLVDSLVGAGIRITGIFAPEHGFRGEAGAGVKIDDGRDAETGIRVISLYGNRRKPSPEDLEDVDVTLFDIQDVGVRFYTYVSTLAYVMEACAQAGIPMILLDRPNPNGDYIDGPILESRFESFVGMHPVPVVHGMTFGEYALMVNGEKWLTDEVHCELSVIQVKNYTHSDLYPLPVPPSPNLPNMDAVYLYPSLCLFEGTIISVGRGTSMPFQVIGHPGYDPGDTNFTPVSIPGKAMHPKFEDTLCRGLNLGSKVENTVLQQREIHLQWLLDMHAFFRDDGSFFNSYFDYLAGTELLRRQIEAGLTGDKIRESWQPGLTKFAQIREKYLLYPDNR